MFVIRFPPHADSVLLLLFAQEKRMLMSAGRHWYCIRKVSVGARLFSVQS